MTSQWVANGNVLGVIFNVTLEELASVIDQLPLLEALLTLYEDLAVEYT